MFKLNDAWRYYLGLTRLVSERLTLSVIMLIGKSFIYVPVVLLVRYALDTAIPNGDWNSLLLNAGAVLLALFFVSFLGIWARRQALSASKTMLKEFRFALVRRAISYSRDRYTTMNLQKVRFAIMSETDRLEGMNYAILTQILPGLISGLFLVGILLFLNWALLMLFIGMLPLLAFFAFIFRKRIGEYHEQYMNKFHSLSSEINQMLNLLDLIHLQSTEDLELEKKIEAIEGTNSASEGVWAQRMLFTELQYFALIFIVLAVFLAGSWSVIGGSMISSELASFYMVLGLLISVLRPIWSSYPMIVAGNVSLKKLYTIFTDFEAPPYSGTQKISFTGQVELRGVDFGYRDRTILKDFNLAIKPGERVAVLGPNGAGKTTILHLLLGFYRPREGEVLIDNVPIENLDLIDLRRQIGVVSQHSLLWPETLWENLAYGNAHASREDILSACRLARVDEFVQELENGYDTLLGEQGVLLSGGQRQRIEIARALVRKPNLLILDEVTNHLDETSGIEILQSIASLPYKPTIIFITHDQRVLQFVEKAVKFPVPEDFQDRQQDVISTNY
jgi:ABC-type multidrug transport system fused ATPase/permease subunit